ncbi:MAG: hypothetical protein KME32_06820 [Mojavia pulchra JT2-VF2]|jgi:hypothetical protein|uniref:Uncharacterized protein n=1 Tax=Mojavia pulchra JT2-VF2 TaxID=287848 RepID=A0A951PXT7_9NOST|nr:hypothetical protein [Mojavia pulchra JT2-VF2]
MLKIFPQFGKFTIAGKVLTSSVFIALLMTLNNTVLGQPTTAPTPKPSQPNQPLQPIAQKILGQWQAKDPSSAIALNFIFSPEGKLYIFSPNSQNPVAVEVKYSINPTPQPMHLNITISKNPEPVLTIFEFTADNQLRLQLDNTDSGKSRPKTFSPTATLFTKVSDTAKLPENVKIIDPRL